MKLTLTIEVDVDANCYGFEQQDERDWFIQCVLGGDLILHSNEIGDEIGAVKVIKHSL